LSSRLCGICNQTFANVDCVRDLDVMVDYRLKFDKHIAEIVHKAMSRANLIIKSFHSHDRTLLTAAYVRPLLEYCSLVWSSHTQCLINEIKKVQLYFTKRVVGLRCMSYDKRLLTLGLQSMEYRRVINDLILYYKIKNGLLDNDIRNNYIVADNLNTRGHSCKLIK